MSSPVYLTDLTSANHDALCARRFWYHKFEGGMGIVPKDQVLSDLMLKETYTDFHTISQMEDLSVPALEMMVEDILSLLTEKDKKNEKSMEILYRRLGWLAAFAIYVEPNLRLLNDTMGADVDIVLDKQPLWMSLSPGRCLKAKQTPNNVTYWQFTPTVSISARWRGSWDHRIEPHLALFAAQQSMKMRIDFVQMVGLSLGYTSSISGHHLVHPYVWAGFNPQTKEWTHNKMSLGAGWIDKPVWEYEGGIVEWVLKAGRNVAEAQFPMSGRIRLNRPMVDNWSQWRLQRERIANGVQSDCHTSASLRAINFPMNTSQCVPMHEDNCPFVDVCWEGGGTAEFPVALKGRFVSNQPHPIVIGESGAVVEGVVM